MVEYDISTVDRVEKETKERRKAQLKSRGGDAPGITEEDVSYKHLANLQKLLDWYTGLGDSRATETQEEMDEVRRQLRARKHGGKMLETTEDRLIIDEGDWDKATSGSWSVPPVLPSGLTPGVLSEIQPNNQKGGFANRQIIVVFDTDEENGSYHAPIYIGLDKALWVLKRLADNLGFSLGDVMDGTVRNIPCLIDWEENNYNGTLSIRIRDAVAPDSEGL